MLASPRATSPGVPPFGVAAVEARNGSTRRRNTPIAPAKIAVAFPAADSDAPSSSRSPAPSCRLRRPRLSAEAVPTQTRSSDPTTSAPAAAASARTTPAGTSCRPPACHGDPPLARATTDTSRSPTAVAAIARTSLRGLVGTARSASIREGCSPARAPRQRRNNLDQLVRHERGRYSDASIAGKEGLYGLIGDRFRGQVPPRVRRESPVRVRQRALTAPPAAHGIWTSLTRLTVVRSAT